MIPLSLAKRKYEKHYSEKRKTDSGEVRIYSEEHVAKRWKKKVEKLKRLEKDVIKLRKEYKGHLTDDNDAKTRATAALIGLIDNTAIRIGNEDSVAESGSFGATTLRKKHAKVKGNKVRFKFKGKSGVQQDILLDDAAVVSEIKKLLSGKGAEDEIFEYEPGKRVSGKIVNSYLKKFDITAKDLRGFHANKKMTEALKKTKDFDKALEQVAKEVGHEAKTLMNQYLDPDFVKKHKKESSFLPPLSKRGADYRAELEDKVDSILSGSGGRQDAEAPIGFGPAQQPEQGKGHVVPPLTERSNAVLPPDQMEPVGRNRKVGPHHITDFYGPRTHPTTGKQQFHSGVDLRAREGTEILSIFSGVITSTGHDNLSGNYVRVKHPDGFNSSYSHLSEVLVSEGQGVSAGQVVGLAGSTGRVTAAHLHLRLEYNGEKIDPAPYLRQYTVIGRTIQNRSNS